METFLKKGLDNDNYLPEGTIQILGVPFQSNSDSDSGATHAIHATPDCSFMLYELIQCYLKKNFQVITVMSNKSPTHYLAAMKKMRINYTSYASKGQLSYLDLFSAPFEDLDFTSVPLSDTCPPTFDPAASFKDLIRVSFDSDSEAITNLTKLAKEVQKCIKVGQFTGVVILFDTLNPLMDSLGASDLEVLQFIQTMQECCAQLRTQKQSVKEVAEPQEDSGDDYYDEDSDDSDDIAAMRARRGLPPKPAAKAAEESKSEGGQHLVANLVFTFDADLFLTQSDKSFYEELIMSQSDFVLEVHANESGYSKDLDGTLILKKNLFEESLLTKIQHKAKTKFKVKETAVDYFEYFTF